MQSSEATRAVNTMDSRTILFPLMLIAALAVIAFSAISMVTMLGWTPESLSSAQPVSRAAAADDVMPKAVREAIAPCVDCAAVGTGQEPARNASPRG